MNLSLASEKRLTIADVVTFSTNKGECVTVDESLQNKLNEDCNTKQALFAVDQVKVPSEVNCVPVTVVRAGLLYRLQSLMSTRTVVRGTVLTTLANLLTENYTPVLSSTEAAGAELIAFLAGKGSAFSQDNSVISAVDALKAVDATPVELTVAEANAFVDHPFLLVAVGILSASRASQLLKIVDCSAALSCEAAGSNFDIFDNAALDSFRQQRGQILSSSNLNVVLEGSKRNAKGTTAAASNPLFTTIPQVVGPCQEAIAIAVKSLDIELNSSEHVALNVGAGVVFDVTQVKMSIMSITNAINELAIAAEKRTAALNVGSLAENSTTGSAWDFAGVFASLSRLEHAIAVEIVTVLKVFSDIESAEQSDKNAKAEKSENTKVVKENVDDPNWTPEQRARAEAKRKAKADKAAAKAAAKDQRRAGIVLGAGSALLRTLFTEKSQFTAESTGAAVNALQTNLDSLVRTEDCLIEKVASILEALHTGGKRRPKIARGTRDFGPEQMKIREQAFAAIRKVFKRHGGVEIDTPVFELREILMGKYGEDSKLIYDLADQGGELLSLRYDLTVPFARFLAMNSVGNIKRFHIAKVYRRDNPQIARGRYREFYQCDFDIAGNYSPMVADAEVITIAKEILTTLPVGGFLIKLNHRRLLDAIFEIAGVPAEKFRPICSAVDKLDKNTWEEVKDEMVNEKGLAPEVADRIGKFVVLSGEPFALWKKMTEEKIFGDHVAANEALAELKLLFDYLDAMGSLPYVSFDMSLARGLDYYTGVIYEAVLTDGTSQIGSIAAGGRYDNLVGMFSPANVQTPCVGISIGIERVFTIMERKAQESKLLQASAIQVYVASIGAGMVADRMRVAQQLWSNDISAEYSHLDNPKLKRQMDEALERGIPFMVIFGKDELKNGVVKVKDMRAHEEVDIPLENVAEELMKRGVAKVIGGDESFLSALVNATKLTE